MLKERNTSQKINYEQQLLDILKEKSEHTDENKTFLLSLVPGFKKLDHDQKYWAKMEKYERLLPKGTSFAKANKNLESLV